MFNYQFNITIFICIHVFFLIEQIISVIAFLNIFFIFYVISLQIGPQHPDVQHIAVSHHGIRLLKRLANGDLTILETIPLEDIVSVSNSRTGVCSVQVLSGVRLPLHTNRAPQLAEMISKYVRQVSHTTFLKKYINSIFVCHLIKT